jgi:hypothetical protein
VSELKRLLGSLALVSSAALTGCTSELAPAKPFPDLPPGSPGADRAPYRAPEVGWTLLGGREIDSARDREMFVLTEGPECEEIRVAVTRGQAEVTDLGISFADGRRFEPRGPLVFDALHREHVLHIPGGRRQVSQVDFRVRRTAEEPLEVAVSGR